MYARPIPQTSVLAFKRKYAPYIKDYERPEIDAGFHKLHILKQSGDHNFEFMDLDKIIWLIKEEAKLARQRHRERLPKAIQTPSDKESALDAINTLKSMFAEVDE